MKLNDLFIGRPVYWALLAFIIAVLWMMGAAGLHVRDFVPFQFAVLGLGVLAVAVVILVYRPGERATREEIEPDDSA